jgi:outer membrane lipoprotein SlyB
MTRTYAQCMGRALVALAGVVTPLGALAQSTAPGPAMPGNRAAPDPVPDCTSFPCGRVETIRQVSVRQQWTPLGSGVTADPGQAQGRVTTTFQIGPGLSNQGMVMLGAGGGAAVKKTPNAYEQPRWEVTVKLDNGQKRVLTVAYEPFVREGDRVRVAGNSLERID